MNTTGQPVQIKGRDYWVKVVDMLQQNWALIDGPAGAQVTVFFVNDRSGVFDRIVFASRDEGAEALARNGFRRYAEDQRAQSMMRPPSPPFFETRHPNG